MGTALTLLGIGAAAIVVPRLVKRFNDRWFDDIGAMDEDYPTPSTHDTWPIGMGGTGGAGGGPGGGL